MVNSLQGDTKTDYFDRTKIILTFVEFASLEELCHILLLKFQYL